MQLYVGVDGGGTKTEVMVCDDLSGKTVLLSGGASNPNTVGNNHAVSVIGALIDEGIQKLNGKSDEVLAVSVCMSGVDRSVQIESIRSLFQPRYPLARCEVANDALAALSAGTHGAPGIVLIAGTGSIAVGESTTGRVARAGGYGSLLGDEASGFEIGRQGLMAAVRFAEERGEFTHLWRHASEFFQLSQPGDLITKVYESEHPIGTIASFARFVLEAAVDDEAARQIVQESARSLARMAISVRHQLNGDVSNQVVLAGGLFTGSAVLCDSLALVLQAQFPDVMLTRLREPPAAGAVFRARRLLSGPSQPTLWTKH